MSRWTTGGLGSLLYEDDVRAQKKAQRRGKNSKPRETRNCAVCNKPFECTAEQNKRTCSFPCAERYHVQQQRERARRRTKMMKLTAPQLRVLREMVTKGATHYYGAVQVRIVNRLRDLGCAMLLTIEDVTSALPTDFGREVAEHGGEFSRQG